MAISDQDLLSFIRSTFRSVWAIELLCHLRARRDQARPSEAIVAALRASHAVVQRGLADLTAAGLVVTEETGDVRYAPASPDLDALAEAAEALYARSPGAVRRMIVAGSNPGITAFADAFKLRKD